MTTPNDIRLYWDLDPIRTGGDPRMTTTATPRTLTDLEHLATHQFYVPHFGLLDGLEREIEALAHEHGVTTDALATHLLHLGLDVYRQQRSEFAS